MPPPSKSISSSGHASTSAASSETHTVGGVATSKACASSSATAFGGALTSLRRTPSGAQNLRGANGTSKNTSPSPGQPFKKKPESHGKLQRPSRFALAGVRILPPLPGHSGRPEPTTASSSQASAFASTSTAGSSSVKVDSRTSSHTTGSQEPVWTQPVYTIKRAATTKSSASASTSTRSASLSVISSSASSSAQVASGSSSSRATASSSSTLASSPGVSGGHSAVHSTSGTSLYGDLSSSVSNSDIYFAGQSGPPVVSGWEGDMQTVSGTPSRAVSSSSASSRGYSTGEFWVHID